MGGRDTTDPLTPEEGSMVTTLVNFMNHEIWGIDVSRKPSVPLPPAASCG